MNRNEAHKRFLNMVLALDVSVETKSRLIDAAHAWCEASTKEAIADSFAAADRAIKSTLDDVLGRKDG